MSDAQPETVEDCTPFPSPYHKNLYLSTIRMLGVQKVEVRFSGSGDSGQIDEVHFIKNGAEIAFAEVENVVLSWPEEGEKFVKSIGKWVRTGGEKDMTLEAITEKLTYDALQTTALDWVNNDGGQGVLEINFDESPPKIDLRVGINYISVDQHDFDFTNGMQEEKDDAP